MTLLAWHGRQAVALRATALLFSVAFMDGCMVRAGDAPPPAAPVVAAAPVAPAPAVVAAPNTTRPAVEAPAANGAPPARVVQNGVASAPPAPAVGPPAASAPPAGAYVDEPAVVVNSAPPAARVEIAPPAPGPGYAWIPGHWAWRGSWVWVAGSWRPIPAGYHQWVRGQWLLQGTSFRWQPGHWA
ncbi:MAG TPA: YXWGXW repeat-containing protein [Polyangiaceae bacterium]|jgi:hypothetical protein